MKATVEFEVNGCHDCIFNHAEPYSFEENDYGGFYEHICVHPDYDHSGDIDYFNNNEIMPEWCPLIKNKKE